MIGFRNYNHHPKPTLSNRKNPLFKNKRRKGKSPLKNQLKTNQLVVLMLKTEMKIKSKLTMGIIRMPIPKVISVKIPS